MAEIETSADCSRCAALCCVAYPSDEMPGFSARKEAGEPCPKLGSDGLCTIYERRADEGFAGCIRYECFGAGQHVVETLFEGRDWRSDPALLPIMIESFLAMRPVSDLLFLARRAEARGDEVTDIIERLEAIARIRERLTAADGLASCERDLRALYRQLGPDRN